MLHPIGMYNFNAHVAFAIDPIFTWKERILKNVWAYEPTNDAAPHDSRGHFIKE